MSSGNSQSATTTNLQVNYDYQNAQRFPAWMALSVFSAVCLAAVNSQQKLYDRNAADKWVLSVTIVSMVFSFLSVLAYLFVRHLFVANLPEMGMTVFLLAIWGAGLPVIMNPERGIAVEGNDVVNANLYFFSWLSLATIVFLTGHLLQEWTGINARDVLNTAASPKTGKWYGLAASSMIVMVSCIRIFRASDCSGDTVTYCKRTKFGISVGALSFVFSISLACTLAKSITVSFMELVATSVMLVFWCFGVGYITFGSSPGAKIGNLYFSTWISFIIIVVIFGQVFRDFLSARAAAANGGGGDGGGDGSSPDEHYQIEAPPAIPADDEI